MSAKKEVCTLCGGRGLRPFLLGNGTIKPLVWCHYCQGRGWLWKLGNGGSIQKVKPCNEDFKDA